MPDLQVDSINLQLIFIFIVIVIIACYGYYELHMMKSRISSIEHELNTQIMKSKQRMPYIHEGVPNINEIVKPSMTQYPGDNIVKSEEKSEEKPVSKSEEKHHDKRDDKRDDIRDDKHDDRPDHRYDRYDDDRSSYSSDRSSHSSDRSSHSSDRSSHSSDRSSHSSDRSDHKSPEFPQEQKNDIDLIDNNLLQSILQINTDMLDHDSLQSHSQIEELPTNEIEELPVSEDVKDISIYGDKNGIPTPEQMEEYRNNTVKELKDILIDLNLPHSGNKQKLIQRIINNKNLK